MTVEKRSRTIDNGNFEGLFPFLILILVGLIRLIKAKKKKESAQRPPPPQRRPEPIPSPTPKAPPLPAQARRVDPLKLSKPLKPEYRSLQVKRDEHFWRKKKKSRIQSLVESTGNKRKIFLMSEILRTPHF